MGRKNRQGDNYWDSDLVDADAEMIENDSAPQTQKNEEKAPKKNTPKKEEVKEEKVQKAEEPRKESTDVADDSTSEQNEDSKGSKSKKKKKKGAAEKEEPKGKKEEPKAKKKGPSKQIKELLLKKKEEEERLQREEEERRKREEEEEKRLEEEAQKEEEIRQQKKEKKKQKLKERQKRQDTQKTQLKREQIQMHFNGSLPPAPKPSASVFKDLAKKKKPTKSEEKAEEKVEENGEQDKEEEKEEVEAKESPVVPTEEKEKEVVAESWEEEALDSWEDVLEKKETPPPQPETPAADPPKEVKEDSSDSKSPEVKTAEGKAGKKGKEKKGKGRQTDEEETAGEALRSPICCVLGHVDTGKTKLLDKIRRSHVQEGEAGGITQQIGATFFPLSTLRDYTARLPAVGTLDLRVPGLLVIDTPGHESFSNLRSRGSGLCDIAVLVIDIMHGLEPQTIESLNLLKKRKTPFVVALNKVDRLFGWKTCANAPIQEALKQQSAHVLQEYETRLQATVTQLAEQSLNAVVYYKNKDFRKYVSLVPTSAHSGEGIPDLLMLLVQLTQKLMADQLLYLNRLQCTVLEVKTVEGLGVTIDVILVNGVLREGDTIVLCGLNGPIVTTIRALLTPQPLKEMRVKGAYVHHKVIRASQGVKISAQDLDKAIAGSALLVVGKDDDLEEIKAEVMQDLESMQNKVDTTGAGVYVQASTLGSLEALLEFLKQSKIPVSGINIGPVNKKDVMRASVMLEREKKYACILAFDVKVNRDARDMAEEMGVRIFTAEIIYHLFDQFTDYIKTVKQTLKDETAAEAVFPCRLKIFPEYIFNKKDPIVLGVEILEGSLRIGTPLVVPSKDVFIDHSTTQRQFCELGRVTSLQRDHKDVDMARKGASVAIKIENPDPNAQSKVYGRHFDYEDELVSKISRKTIDVLKESHKEDLTKEDIKLLVKLKTVFHID